MTRPHILGLGQSNLANHCGERRSVPGSDVVLLGETLPLADPVPGGTGDLGSVWTRLATPDRPIRVTLAAQGGTSIEEWAPGGPCFEMLQTRIDAGDCKGVIQVVFQQGEKDTLLETTQADYVATFRRMYDAVVDRIGQTPWLLCQSSYRMGVVSPAVIAAQVELADTIPDISAGPNLDRLGSDFRRDDTHFNDAGLEAYAADLARLLSF